MRIYLTGFMGSGKSTIGREAAGLLQWPFVDLDKEIELRSRTDIGDIFRAYGESEFRKLEAEALQSIRADPSIVATGGGCFIHNRDWMLQNGVVVYLKTSFSILAGRIGADSSRPLWKNAERLFEERRKHYEQAHYTVDASLLPEEVAAEILRIARQA